MLFGAKQMVTLPANFSRNTGLTLIEVLVALAIVSIALTAIIKSVSENIRSTSYLQNKTIALYVAQEVMNEVRLGVLKSPGSERLQAKTNMLGNDWYWQMDESITPNTHIKKLTVDVYADEYDKDASPLMSLIGYIYAAE